MSSAWFRRAKTFEEMLVLDVALGSAGFSTADPPSRPRSVGELILLQKKGSLGPSPLTRQAELWQCIVLAYLTCGGKSSLLAPDSPSTRAPITFFSRRGGCASHGTFHLLHRQECANQTLSTFSCSRDWQLEACCMHQFMHQFIMCVFSYIIY